jgi:hypothetical protein
MITNEEHFFILHYVPEIHSYCFVWLQVMTSIVPMILHDLAILLLMDIEVLLCFCKTAVLLQQFEVSL